MIHTKSQNGLVLRKPANPDLRRAVIMRGLHDKGTVRTTLAVDALNHSQSLYLICESIPPNVRLPICSGPTFNNRGHGNDSPI